MCKDKLEFQDNGKKLMMQKREEECLENPMNKGAWWATVIGS